MSSERGCNSSDLAGEVGGIVGLRCACGLAFSAGGGNGDLGSGESLSTLTNGHELLRDVLAGGAKDGRGAARVALEEGRAVVDVAVDDEPGLVLAVVGPQLVEGDLAAVDALPGHADLLGLGRLGAGGSRALLLARRRLAPEAVGDVAAGLLDALHPAAGQQGGLAGVFEAEGGGVLAARRLPALAVDDDAVPRVVHHAQHAPVHVAGLHHHGVVHGADHDVLRRREVRHGHGELPEAPAERRLAPRQVHPAAVQPVVLGSEPIQVLRVVDVGQGPRFALVERDLDARDAFSPARVGVAADLV